MIALDAQLSAVIFSGVTLTPWFVERNKQIFHPMKMKSGIQVAMIAPAAFLAINNPDLFTSDVLNYVYAHLQGSIAWALLMLALCNAFTYIGYYGVATRLRRTETIATTPAVITRVDAVPVIVMLLAIGSVLYLFKLRQVGGISFVLNNIGERTSLQSGLGPLNFIVTAAFNLASIVAARRHAFLGGRSNLLLLLLTYIVAAVSATTFGGRKDTLQLLLVILFVYSVCRPNFMIASVKKIPIILGMLIAVIFYFFSVLSYRNSPDFETFVDSIPTIGKAALDSVSASLMSMSYMDSYVFVTYFFRESNYYLGKTYIDLTTAFLPSAIYPNKPPVDEGLYVRIASLGGWLEPGTPAYTLKGVASWPPETMGAAYMNGGPLLVAVGGLILGVVLAKGNQWALARPNSALALLAAALLSLDFELTTLRIVSFVSLAGAAFVLMSGLRVLGFSTRPLRSQLRGGQ